MEFSSQLIRYMSPLIICVTLVLLADVSLLDRIVTGELPAAAAAFGIIPAFLVGAVLHFVYHLLYPYTFAKLQDAIFKETYRTYLRGACSISEAQSVRLFRKLRSSNFLRGDDASIYTDAVKMEAAVIHALYFMSGASLIFSAASLFVETSVGFFVFLIIAVLSLLLGLALDKRYEELELDVVRSIPTEKLLEACRTLRQDVPQPIQEPTPPPSAAPRA